MRVLHDAHVRTGIHHALDLICTSSAHVKSQFTKLGRTLQEKSGGSTVTLH